MVNWRTTVLGICTILGAVSGLGSSLVNGQEPQWAVGMSAIMSGLGLIFARDAKVGTAEAGRNVKPWAGRVGLVLMVLAMVAAVGCSTTANRLAYRSAGVTEATVDAAMKGWASYVVWKRGQTPGDAVLAGQEARVREAYSVYRQAMNGVYAAQGAIGAGRTNGATDLQLALSAVREASQALTAILIQLLPDTDEQGVTPTEPSEPTPPAEVGAKAKVTPAAIKTTVTLKPGRFVKLGGIVYWNIDSFPCQSPFRIVTKVAERIWVVPPGLTHTVGRYTIVSATK
jgi:hypothetical protein